MSASIQASSVESGPPIPRLFESGQYVRVVGTRFNGRVGYLCKDNGSEEEDMPYFVALFDDEHTDENFSASTLSRWVPAVGERVVELGHEGDEVGVVLANDGTTSHVQWRSLKDAPYWPNIRLQPADETTT